MHDALFGVRAARRFIFLAWNSEKQDGLQTQIESALRLFSDFADRELENPRHALDRLPRREFFADEKRQNKIVRGEFCFAHKIAHALAASQSSRPMN